MSRFEKKAPYISFGLVVAAFMVLCWAVFRLGFRNVDDCKEAADRTWAASGYEITGYERYLWSPINGGDVWYLVQPKDRNGITYHGYLAKWGNEFHIYGLTALDALKPAGKGEK